MHARVTCTTFQGRKESAVKTLRAQATDPSPKELRVNRGILVPQPPPVCTGRAAGSRRATPDRSDSASPSVGWHLSVPQNPLVVFPAPLPETLDFLGHRVVAGATARMQSLGGPRPVGPAASVQSGGTGTGVPGGPGEICGGTSSRGSSDGPALTRRSHRPGTPGPRSSGRRGSATHPGASPRANVSRLRPGPGRSSGLWGP